MRLPVATSILDLGLERAPEVVADGDDLRLVEALRNGVEEAYEGLLARFQQPVYTLALRLLGFGRAVEEVTVAAEPHKLAAFLFETASAFTTFYEQCPVLTAAPQTRQSRLALCALTLRVLVTGLGLLGITVPARM